MTISEKLNARQRLQKFKDQYPVIAKKSLGQNFLVNDNVISKIIRQAVDSKPKQLIEVGPGPGALTELLSLLKVPMTLIELDHNFATIWRERNFEVIEQDALQLDWNTLYKTDRVVLVSNLPYQISSSIVIDRSIEKVGVEEMILMFQKEVAQRIRAKHGTDAYGLLSVVAQAFWNIETVTDASPGDFIPAPKVASRVLYFKRKVQNISDRSEFLKLVKEAFKQRRKLLKSNLKGIFNDYKFNNSEETLVNWLTENGYTPTARAEELTVDKFIDLYHFLIAGENE